MAKYKAGKISYKDQDRLMDMFCSVLASFKTKEIVKDFLKDLLNRQERIMLIRRLLIAEMIEEGRTYREIIKKLSCGSPTIARVERWLNFGRMGYKHAISAKKK